MALDRQINLFKVDTNAFLTDEENKARIRLIKLKRVQLKIRAKAFNTKKDDYIKKFIKEHAYDDKEQSFKKENDLSKYELLYLRFNEEIKLESKKWKEFILKSASDSVQYNNEHLNAKRIRTLDERYISYIDKQTNEKKVNLTNIISMFESSLSRSFGIKTNELTYDIFVLEIFYYDIAQDLIVNGFDYNGKHYVYFSSSAGQIRTKKAVFVEESKFESCKLKLMCGLTIDKINEQGGMNINKFLAYLALANSATDLWEDIFNKPFDIDKSIVVDDFETMVKCKVDNIDYVTYEITPDVVQDMPIPHTDGCGMILSSYSKKNFMVRLPFIKGLLGSFDYVRFINENNCSGIVKDIWGIEHDIIKEDIQVIFTKSQLKMYKYYSSWDEYKTNFKQYGCEACVCNMEEDKISNAKINYQMLQTLYDATDEEIKELCKVSNKKIQDVSNSLDNALEFFGVHLDDDIDTYKDYFQKSLKIYPELLTDPASKDDLRDLKNSLIKKYRGARLDVMGKFTFVLPDFYAFCEWLFLGIEQPLGLLENNEVFCRLYKNSKELDCLRSPHLYIEHAIRNNVCNKKYRNQKLDSWFTTDAIYTSTYDLISRILQFDVDGDRLLVLAQKLIINMAKRVMSNVNPLYYEMKKAKAEIIDKHSIYHGLKLAFTGGNIGTISNDITKIWNSGVIDDRSMLAVRWLCMETNFTIDYAKTLFKPTRPDNVDVILKQYGKQNVPHFFYYAKDKTKNQVEKINDSTINKIVKEIKDNHNMFRPMKNLELVNYKLLLNNQEDKYFNADLNKCFDKWNRKYGNLTSFDEDNTNKNNLNYIAITVKEALHEYVDDDDLIINSLVSSLYKKKTSRKKKLLWYVYGEQLYNNLLTNVKNPCICHQCGKRVDNQTDLVRGKCTECRTLEIKANSGNKIIKCIDCGKEFQVSANSRVKRCDECKHIKQLEWQKQSMDKKRKCEVVH